MTEPDVDTLEAEALIGDDAERFLSCELGKVIIGLAQQDADAAAAELKEADPENAKLIRELQARIWRAESFEAWLRNLITDGAHALHSLEFDTEGNQNV